MPDNASPAPVAPRATVRFRALGSLDLQRPGTGELRALLVQPKRLALFAYLLLARPFRLHRRDSLLVLFWPESTEEQARRALRQALHFLRQSLGGDVLMSRGDEEVGVVAAAAWCDVHEFDRALDEGRRDDALALYRGPLLDGFHVTGVAPELGQWIEAERARVHARAVEAATLLADATERDGNPALAVQRLRELLRLDPGAETALRRLMALLDKAGDRAGALRAYDEFARRLERDVGAEPARASAVLAERIRAGRTSGAQVLAEAPPHATTFTPPALAPAPRPKPAYVPAPRAPLSAPQVTPAPAAASPRGASRRHLRWLVPLALLGAATAIVTLSRGPSAGSMTDAPLVLAVGVVGDGGGDSATSTRVLRDLLATDLARVPGIRVVSTARLQELLAREPDAARGRPAVLRAARGSGADEVLEGELHRRSPTTLRLDVRRVDVRSGVIHGAYTVEGPDLFTLVERASGALATELGRPMPSPGLARAATPSLAAWRLFVEGKRAAYLGDNPTALRLFEAALAEDSAFAMAALWGGRVAGQLDGDRQIVLLSQAMRAALRAPPADRLRIRVAWALATNDTASLSLADSLVRLDPHDLDVAITWAEALIGRGEFARAIPVLHSVVARDTSESGALRDDAVTCTACLALANLGHAYNALDSADAAERALRAWARLRPHAHGPWMALAITMNAMGRTRVADEAWARWRAAAPSMADLRLDRAVFALRRGAFAEADGLLAELARDGGRAMRAEAFWWQAISFRMQGRLDAAMRAALQQRAAVDDLSATLAQGQVLFEIGRTLESARTFASHARRAEALLGRRLSAMGVDSAPGMYARTLVWSLAHAASGHAAAGDTVRLAALADSLERLGARSAFGRDRRLHHHLRGLLWKARGRPDEAIAELRRAMVSPTLGYTRTNLELGRMLIAAGRPREAAGVLASALRGDLQASNYYVTHTELQEALAMAHDAAGMRDSARVHWAWVANAWSGADPPFRERAARARERAVAR